MKKLLWLLPVGALLGPVLFGFVLLLSVGGNAPVYAADPYEEGTPGAYTCGPLGTFEGVTAEQQGYIATIIQTGRELGVPTRGLVVAVATARQESGWLNLDYGDRDSLGLFQQRPSQGWGTPAQIRDPVYASTRFYQSLLAVPGWEQMPVTVAAQRVQRSGFPDAYAQWEAISTQLVTAALTGAQPCEAIVVDGWTNPVAGPYRRTSGFGQRWGRLHAGVDLAGKIGTPIVAAAAGRVSFAGPSSGYGNLVVIEHGSGNTTRYGHLHSILARPGQVVAAGAQIATLGNTGRSTGPHLHFEVRWPGPVDPAPFMADRGVIL